MGNLGFSAFSGADFHSVFDPPQVWMDRPVGHLPLHERALGRFHDSLQRAKDLRDKNPLGLCFVGPAGSGKTHLLGEIRRDAAEQEANFILSDLTDVRDFWGLLAMHCLQSLQKPMNGLRQLQRVLEVLLREADDVPDAPDVLHKARSLSREGLVSFATEIVTLLRPAYGEDIRKRHRVFRALLYLEADDLELSERAYSFLQGIEQIDPESQKIFLSGPNSAKSVAVDLAWFLSLCGPTVLAFDQLDPFVVQNSLSGLVETPTAKQQEALQVLFGVVTGIFAVRQEFDRTLIVLVCLESSWRVLQERAVGSFQHRFEQIEYLQLIHDDCTPLDLIVSRLDDGYHRFGFAPPYPTWPFAPAFFSSLPPGMTPREILNRCEAHRLSCVRSGNVTELHAYSEIVGPIATPDLSSLDSRFLAELTGVDPDCLMNETNEDALGDLLGEAAHLLRRELPSDPGMDFAVEDDFHETKQYESLHLRMRRRVLHVEGDREEHVCVRILQKANARSFQVRLTAALTTSGMSEKLEGRRLFLLRNGSPPSGDKTAELVSRARECGAEFLPFSKEDVRTMAAVVALSKSEDPLFETWLLNDLPLSKTALFRHLIPAWLGRAPQARSFAAVGQTMAGENEKHNDSALPKPAGVAAPSHSPTALRTQILLGLRMEAGLMSDPLYLPPVDLTRHVMLRAGSGGGKTVFVKRLVEEAALCGVPSIVIDTAKDLSMLGDRWEQPPTSWTEADAQLADQYHRSVDVRIWTPGHAGGRPLRLTPLPNLSGPFSDPHDREQALEIAVSGLLSLAVQKKNATVERAILKKVVGWLARQQHGDGELERLITALRDLPAETLQGYQNERKLAAAMADQVQAAVVADPLYGDQGEELDPAALFGIGSPRTQVSVLSLFAMPDIATQARFIGQSGKRIVQLDSQKPVPCRQTCARLVGVR